MSAAANPRTSTPDFPPEFLSEIERTVMSRSGRAKGNEIVFRCPIEGHEDKNPDASYNTEKHTWYCYACKFGGGALDLASRLGIEKPERRKRTPLRTIPPNKIVATYDYTENGQLIFQVVRREPKSFTQRRPDGDGGWIYNLQGVKRVLYHHDEVVNATGTVYLVEGEKDADRLRSLGLLATTCAMGAGKWLPEYTATLAGHDVVILPDNDDAGRQHAHQVASQLYASGCSVRVGYLPGLPKKGDASNWLDMGNSIEDVISFVNGLPEWEPADEATPKPSPLFPTTDTGNAERLVHHHGQDLRYINTHKTWMVWTGTHWERDSTGCIGQLAKKTVRAIPDEAKNLDGDAWKRHLDWAKSSESAARRAAMIELARSEEGIPARPEDFDRDPWLLNVANGTLDLRTGKLRPHDRKDLISKLAPVTYDPTATCPTFLGWLNEIMLNRADLVTFLQRAMGYSLTGKVSERVVLILHGGGRNGKTTLLETVGGILGNYAGTAPAEMLLAKRETGIPNDVARLPGARFVSATETGEGRRLDEVKVKSISGGDTIQARFMHADWFDFRPTFKIWLGTNHKPEIRGTDNAIWDRIRLLPFDYRVPDDQKISDLSDSFIAQEAAGILAWVVAGCLAWQESGLSTPREVMQATAGYRREMDALASWIEDRCDVRDGARASAKALYEDYVTHCKSLGEEPIPQRTFGGKLKERGFVDGKSGSVRYWTGIRLLDPNEPTQTTFSEDDTSQSPHQWDATRDDMSHQKSYESGDSDDWVEHMGHMGHDFRGNRPIETSSRNNPETNVPYVPYVPNGESGDDPWTR